MSDWIKKVVHFSYLDNALTDVYFWMDADDSGGELATIGLLINNFDTGESVQQNIVFDLEELKALQSELNRIIAFVEEHTDPFAELRDQEGESNETA